MDCNALHRAILRAEVVMYLPRWEVLTIMWHGEDKLDLMTTGLRMREKMLL
jgi:hypothetical protein